MRRLPPREHLAGLPICTLVAVRLVKLGACSGADVAWLRAVGGRWHPLDGSLSLPDGDDAPGAPAGAATSAPASTTIPSVHDQSGRP